MSNDIQYGGWSGEGEDFLNAGPKLNYLQVQEGTTTLRFLPPRVGEEPFVATSQHFVERPGLPKVVFCCPRRMARMPCPACIKAEKLKATGNAVDREAAKALFDRTRIFANVLEREHPERGVQVYAFGITVWRQLCALKRDPDVGDFTRPDATGFDIKLGRAGKGRFDTEYTVRPAVKPCALGDLGLVLAQPALMRLKEVLAYDDIVRRLKGDPSQPKPAMQPQGDTSFPYGANAPAHATSPASPASAAADEGW